MLFGEHIKQAREYSYKPPNDITEQIISVDQLSEVFTTVRGNLPFNEVERRGGGDQRALKRIESGMVKPEDLTIIHFCSALGYGFYHPLTQEMLYKSWRAKH